MHLISTLSATILLTAHVTQAAHCWGSISNGIFNTQDGRNYAENWRQVLCKNNNWKAGTAYIAEWYSSSPGTGNGAVWQTEWVFKNLDSESRCWGSTADITNQCITNSAVGSIDAPTGGATTGGEWDSNGMVTYGGYWFVRYGSSKTRRAPRSRANPNFVGDTRVVSFGAGGEIVSDTTYYLNSTVSENTVHLI